ncbi:MAG: thiamine-phosphate kinase [Pseudomonadota bacterium]
MSDAGGEFQLIAQHLAPLSRDAPGAFGLTDDAAVITPPAGERLVVAKDVVVENVHFLKDDPPETIARKALRVNLSDLAAKGARPFAYLLGCVWRAGTSPERIAAFARGLAADQAAYGVALHGGDTAVHDGPAMFCVTVFGARAGGMPLRSGAGAGEDVYVTGAIGDAGLGLAVLQKRWRAPGEAAADFLIDRYRLPRPRAGFGVKAADMFSASIDVSDGLIADAGHIARASNVRLEINAGAVPLSEAAAAGASEDRDRWTAALAAMGDDYEILFTADPARREALSALAVAEGVRLSRIGRTAPGEGVILLDGNGAALELDHAGFQHKI